MNVVDLLPKLDETSILELLSYCIGYPTPSKLGAICESYRSDPQQYLFGLEEDEQLLGCIGARIEASQQGVLQCVAVLPARRGQGIGKQLVNALCREFELRKLTAETDQDAVEFYRRCGFKVTSLGELYPNTERFLCLLQR